MIDTVSSKSSETTKTRILNATWKLLKTEGASARMADVAKEAGVSRQAVYLHFPSRAELLIATTRYIDEVEDVAGQLESVFGHAAGRDQLEAFVNAWGNYIPVVYGGAKSLLALKDTDADAAAAWDDRMTGLYGACAKIVATLASSGELADDLSRPEATNLMWAIVSVRQWELLRLERKMSQKKYLALTIRTLLRTLVNE